MSLNNEINISSLLKIKASVDENGELIFITGVNGECTIEILEEIENQLLSDPPEHDGDYIFSAQYEQAQTGEYGMIELEAYWDLTQLNYKPFDNGCDPCLP